MATGRSDGEVLFSPQGPTLSTEESEMHPLVFTVALAAAADPTLSNPAGVDRVEEGSRSVMHSRAWDGIPYPMGTELALAASKLDITQISVLSAETWSDVSALHRVRIQRVTLSDGAVVKLVDGALPETCTPFKSVVWQDGTIIQTYPAGEQRTANGEVAASLLLVSGNPELSALVAVCPGDTVETREVSRAGQVRRRLLVLRRGTSTLTFEQSPTVQRVCYSRTTA